MAGVVAVPGEPFAVAVSDDRAFVSTSSSNFDAVSVIDTVTQTVVATYSLAFSVTALAASPDGKRVYAGRTGDGYVDVVVIDTTAERVGTIDIATGAGIGIDAVRVDPTGKRLYVATTDARGSALVAVDVETARVQRTVSIGSPIRDIAFADGVAYVLTSDRVRGGAVKVVDLSTGRITGHRRTRSRRPDSDDDERRQDACVHRGLRQRHGAVHTHPQDRQQGDGRRAAVMCRSRFRRGPALCGRLLGRGDRVVGRHRPCRCCTRSSWRPIRSTCPRLPSWSPSPPDVRCAGRSRAEQTQKSPTRRCFAALLRLLAEEGSVGLAPLVTGLGAARLAVVRVTGDRALVGEPFEVSPRGHP